MKTTSLVILLFFMSFHLVAQQDSIALRANQLLSSDIEKTNVNTNEVKQKVLVINRFENDADNATQPIYVVTKEEIRRMGYSSLLDVLRMLPGMQISPSGSGLMGEHFALRGLLGNQYMKIMINDIPIRPLATLGMPLGNQLPIKQAERIEIQYGSAIQYGEDACVGVINIITKESERPAYTNAEIKFGPKQYNEVNVFFGGKFGKDKNIVRFDIYGNNTSCKDRNIYTGNDSVFLLQNYKFEGRPLLSNILKHPNLVNQGIYNKEVFLGELPYSSHSFGLHLKYKGLSINADNFYRKDHSALGYNTRAVSYGSTSDYIGENISKVSIGWQKNRRRVIRKTNLYGIIYKMDSQSSTTYLQPTLLRELVSLGVKPLSSQKTIDALNKYYIDTFFLGKRYSNTYSLESAFETVSKRSFGKHFGLNIGSALKIRNTISYLAYNPFPIENINNYKSAITASAFKEKVKALQTPNSEVFTLVSNWAKLNFSSKKVLGSIGYHFLVDENASFHPRNSIIKNFFGFQSEIRYEPVDNIYFTGSISRNMSSVSNFMGDSKLRYAPQNVKYFNIY
jgi:TonB-dependent Receptor Plug Domain